MPILDDATTEALIAQHGPNLEFIEFDYFDGPVVIRPPKPEEVRLFRDEASVPNVDDRIRYLAQSCIVFPTVESVNEAAKERAAMMLVIGGQVTQLAGFQLEVKRKKLVRPSKTQR